MNKKITTLEEDNDNLYLSEIPHTAKENVWNRITLFQLIYSVLGLILGLVCILGGIYLFLQGITGSTSWTTKILGNESQISDAAPGAILFIVGLFIIIVTKYKVKVIK